MLKRNKKYILFEYLLKYCFVLVPELIFDNKALGLVNKGIFIHYPVLTGIKVLFFYDNFCYVQHTAKKNEVRWKCINYKFRQCKAFVVVDKQQLAQAMVEQKNTRHNKLVAILTVVRRDKYPHTHCASQFVVRF